MSNFLFQLFDPCDLRISFHLEYSYPAPTSYSTGGKSKNNDIKEMQGSKSLMEPDTQAMFSVIIVGAGITGLVLANMLKKLGIESTLLEAHAEIEHPMGASFGIWPNAARIFDQLGCWEEILNAGKPIKVNNVRCPDGQILMSNDISRTMVERFVLCFHREDLAYACPI